VSWFGSVQIREVIYTCLAVADPRGGGERWIAPPPETQKKKKMGQKEKKKKRKKKRKKKEKEEKKPNELIPIGNYPVKQWRLPPESMKQDFTQPITLFIAVSQSYLVISLKVK